MSGLRPFHLAFPVDDLKKARHFYTQILGATCGRESSEWIDFNFFGHQIVAHLVDHQSIPVSTRQVDGKGVPCFHFGIVLEWNHWHELKHRLETEGTEFLIKPCIRFQSKPGEQATFFIQDPSGNAIEMKAFRNLDQLFEVGLEKY